MLVVLWDSDCVGFKAWDKLKLGFHAGQGLEIRVSCVCRVPGVHDMLRAFSAHSSSQRTHGREKTHKLLTACF